MIEILQNKEGKYYFRVKAENGEILCHSESYESKQGCVKGVNALVRVLNPVASVNPSGSPLYKKLSPLITDCPCYHEEACNYACPCHNPLMSGGCYACEGRPKTEDQLDRAWQFFSAREGLDKGTE